MVPEFNTTEALRFVLSNDPSLKLQALRLSSLDQFLKNFAPGQVVSGKVIDQLPSGKNLVELNGNRAVVKFNQPQTPGRIFQAKVEGLTPAPVFKLLTDSSSSTIPGRSDGIGKAPQVIANRDQVNVSAASQRTLPSPTIYSSRELSHLGLKPGIASQGQIQSVLDSQFVQVRLNGLDVTIFHSRAGELAEGAPISVRPEIKADGYILRAGGAGKNNSGLELLKNLLPERQPLSQLIKDFEGQFARLTDKSSNGIPSELKARIQESLEVLRGAPSEPVDSKAIRENIVRTGASYEARLKQFLENPQSSGLKNGLTRDFKGQLQELSKVLESQVGTGNRGSDPALQSLGRQAQTLIQNLDIHQLTQVVARQENHPMTLLIPNMLEPQGRPIKVFYREDGHEEKRNNKDGTSPYTLVFFLELSNLGKVRLDARVQEKKLGLNIAVENSEVLSFVESGFSLFQDHLNELGFVSELKGAINPEKVNENLEEFPETFVKNLNSLVDLRT